VKVAHHFSGGASVVLRVRPEGTIGYEFWSYRVRSIVQRFTVMPDLAFEAKVRTFLSSLRDASLLKPHSQH
jgi:hypothetical protein